MTIPAVSHATTPPTGGTRVVRNILEDAPAPLRPRAFMDSGAAAVARDNLGNVHRSDGDLGS